MSLDEKRKKELEKRIKEQRRAVWKGENSSKKSKRKRWSDLLPGRNTPKKQDSAEKDNSKDLPFSPPPKPQQSEDTSTEYDKSDIEELKQKINERLYGKVKVLHQRL